MSIESDYFQRTVAQIKEHWFPKHVARSVKYEVPSGDVRFIHNSPIDSLIWAEPGTSTYLVRYLLLNSTLMVTGDIGSAIYRWGHDKDMGFEWIAKCNFSYFAEKIAGLNRDGESREWVAEVCELRAREFFQHSSATRGDWTNYTAFQDEWGHYINDNQKLFGDFDGCSGAAQWGLVPSNRCIGHWMGLRLAMGVEKL